MPLQTNRPSRTLDCLDDTIGGDGGHREIAAARDRLPVQTVDLHRRRSGKPVQTSAWRQGDRMRRLSRNWFREMVQRARNFPADALDEIGAQLLSHELHAVADAENRALARKRGAQQRTLERCASRRREHARRATCEEKAVEPLD